MCVKTDTLVRHFNYDRIELQNEISTARDRIEQDLDICFYDHVENQSYQQSLPSLPGSDKLYLPENVPSTKFFKLESFDSYDDRNSDAQAAKEASEKAKIIATI